MPDRPTPTSVAGSLPQLPLGRSLPQVQAPAHPPPFRLPGEHFAAALAWLGLGSVGLVLVAPELARGNFLAPRVFAVTHAFTLGVITTTIFGALYQLFPVTMGVGVRSVRVGHWTFWVLQAGVVLLTGGFWFWWGWAQAIGWVAVALAMGALASNLVARRRQATQGLIIGRYVAAAHAGLGTALLLAFARIGETLGWWHLDRLGIIAAHFHLAAFGFATLTVVGIGSRMLPMFLVSHGAAQWPLRTTGPVAGAGLVLFTAGQLTRLTPVTCAGALLLAAGAAFYLYLVLDYFRRRATPRLDPALAHIALAFLGLAATVVAGLGLLVTPGGVQPRGWAAYGVLAIAGWLVLLIIGVYYRILPFLTWLHLFGAGPAGSTPVTAADLVRPSWAWTSLALQATGLPLLVTAVLLGDGGWARAGASLYLLGVGLVLAQAIRAVARRRP